MTLNVNNLHTKKLPSVEQNSNIANPLSQNLKYIAFNKNKNLSSDAFVSSNANTTDDHNDGKISFKEGAKSFLKGLVSPITNMFKSPKNFLIGVGMMMGGAALIMATGGAAAPVLVAIGATMGGIQVVKGAIGVATAKTDDEAKQAFENIGAGTGVVTMSVAGAKSSLKSAGVNTEGLNPITATAKCFTTAPKNIGTSINAFTQGKALTNIKSALGIKQKTVKPKKEAETANKSITESEAKPQTEPKAEVKAEPKAEPKAEIKPEVKTEPKVESNVENSAPKKPLEAPEIEIQKNKVVEPRAEIKAEPKAEIKPEVKTEPKVEQTVSEPKPKVKAEPKAEVKTAKQTLEEAKTRFFEERKGNIASYEDRIKYCKQKGYTEWAIKKYNLANEENYLESLWLDSQEYSELALPAKLETFNSRQMQSYMRAKEILNKNGVEFNELDLANEGEIINYGLEKNLYNDTGTVNGHGSAYGYNNRIRMGKTLIGEDKLWSSILDKGLENVPGLEEEAVVYRGVSGSTKFQKHNGKFIQDLIGKSKGDTFVDSGYSYASYKEGIADYWSRGEIGVKLTIKVPKGAKVSSAIYSEQSEMLFPRNAQFRILQPAKLNEKGIYEIVAEYVLPN